MIATRLGIIVASVIALVLAVIVVIDRGRDEAPASRALVDNFDAAQVTRLAWSHGGEPELVLERAAQQWRWTKPIAGVPGNASTIDATVAALRGGRWHRRAAVSQAQRLWAALTVTAGSRTIEIGIGKALEGAGQTWIVIGERAYLVDDWIVRALNPEPLSLRETRPLRDVAAAKTLVIDRLMPSRLAVRLEGTRMVRPIELTIHRELVTRLHRALSQMTIRSLPKPGDSLLVMTVSIDAPQLVTVEFRHGGCEDGVAISGTYGPGCIANADYEAIDAELKMLANPSMILVEQVPARFDPLRITLTDGGVLDLEKRPRIGDRNADPARVAELLAVLSTATSSAVDSDPAIKPIAKLVVTDRGGATHELELLPNHQLRRAGEPVALVLGAGASEILARPSNALRDPTLWTEDETTIRTITIDQTTYTRGAVIGEWARSGPGSDDAQAASDLARMLAKLRATDAARAPFARHTITFATAPPSGPPVTRTLQIGDRCGAIVDGKPVALDAAVCQAVARLVR